MKALKWLLLVLGLLVAGWLLVLPGVLGFRSETQIRDDISRASQNGIGTLLVKLDKYDRGWFGSSARVVYALPFGPRFVRLAVDYHVNQLAIPFVRWVRTDYTMTPVDAAGNATAAALPVNAYTIKTFAGSSETTLSMADFDWNQPGSPHVSLKNLAVQLSSEEGKPTRYSLTLPAANVQLGDNAAFAVNMTDLQWSGSWQGGQNGTEPWLADSQQKLGLLEVVQNQQALLRLSNLDAQSTLQDHGPELDTLYKIHLQSGQLGSLLGKNVAVDDVHLDFSYHNINKQAYLDWQNQLRQFYSRQQDLGPEAMPNPAAASAAGKQQIALFMQMLPAMLSHSPGFHIDQYRFHTAQGSFKGGLTLDFDGKGLNAADVRQDKALELINNRLTGHANMAVDQTLLQAWLPAPASAAAASAPAAPAPVVSNGLQQWLAQGILLEQDKQYTLDIRFGHGQWMLNGKPFTPPLAAAMNNPAVSPAPAQAVATAVPAPALAPAVTQAAAPPSPSMPVVQARPASGADAPADQQAVATIPPLKTHRPLQHQGRPRDARSCLALGSDEAIAACAERYR